MSIDDYHSAEKGHRIPNALLSILADSYITGFAACGVGCLSVGVLPSVQLATLTSIAVATSEACRDQLDELIYDHELAREVWEHKMSPFMEVQEFVEHAEKLGVPEEDATELGRRFVKYPQISVPYHLGNEVGLIKSRTYGLTLRKLAIRSIGYIAGTASASLCIMLCRDKNVSEAWQGILLANLLILPVSGMRFMSSSGIKSSSSLYALSGLSFAVILSLASVRWS